MHLKHPKVLNPVDILVICSKYSEFKFSEENKIILEDTINYVNMEIPALNEEYWIEYESVNETICAATGSNKIAMLAGIKKGNSVVRATLKTKKGTVGTSEMAVIVEDRNKVKSERLMIKLQKSY